MFPTGRISFFDDKDVERDAFCGSKTCSERVGVASSCFRSALEHETSFVTHTAELVLLFFTCLAKQLQHGFLYLPLIPYLHFLFILELACGCTGTDGNGRVGSSRQQLE